MTHRLELRKPDGRSVALYARHPLTAPAEVPEPRGGPVDARPHVRWHPFRAEWVAYAGHRQDRTFLPPPDYDPLAPTRPGGEPTELPAGDWEVAVFENRFPSLRLGAPAPAPSVVPTGPGTGVCEVVVYTQDREGSLGDLSLDRVDLLLEVWGERTRALGSHPEIRYVMPFENRGIEVGATLSHPHGQIYAYATVPSIPATEQREERHHWEHRGKGLLASHIEDEIRSEARVLYRGDAAVAFVPAFARYPYEVWVAPRAPVPSLDALDAPTRADLARALRLTVRAYDALFAKPFPYVMVFHQAPTDGSPHPEAHLHAEFYPPYRTATKLKYLAGTEIGAGFFTNDSIPEEKAAELRKAAAAVMAADAESPARAR
ncbi:MAG TPA: galactose-1-phosphate uridylyltransferase [Candidatus Eisenbacteria bacterium]|nr:galactose-1-phosphate uridylyltransferase [Candidatus Eisenbacteria bacterium]